MKCKNKILRYKKSKNVFFRFSPNTPQEEIDEWLATVPQHRKDTVDLETYEICDGSIKAQIHAVDDPYFFGVSASLSVNFVCDSCGFAHTDDFPTEYTINDWVNAILDKMERE